MITRLKVNGFKNLVNVDVRFGAFTCIAGLNGTGKSNLFDAIHFLSLLSEKTLIEAALSVRDEEGKSGDIQSLFHRASGSYGKQMDFEVEMIVPESGVDDYGQDVYAAWTFLRYKLSLGYRASESIGRITLEVLNEELERIPKEAVKLLLFPKKVEWVNSVVKGSKSTLQNYLTTVDNADDKLRKVSLRQDTGGRSDGITHKRGNPTTIPAANLPRTVLSSINSAERPTVLMAKREMQSWRQLRLEPSALRRPDRFPELMSTQTVTLDVDGGHLPATLYRLSQRTDGEEIKSGIRNRLSALLGEMITIEIDVDHMRQQISLSAKWRDGTTLPARSLSEGTLRFLALAVLEHDPEVRGVICLEEPENGIHPGRVKEMIALLRQIAMDTSLPIGNDNPPRQIIINTHSPNVVKLMEDDSILLAESRETIYEGQRTNRVAFSCVSGTWRSGISGAECVSKGKLFDYLNPEPMENEPQKDIIPDKKDDVRKPKLMKYRTDLLTLSLPYEDFHA